MEDFNRCCCVQSDKYTRRSVAIAAATVDSSVYLQLFRMCQVVLFAVGWEPRRLSVIK